ncbi:uncharacterized protein LOC135930718, partial [Gordionus sp. m RMFG-2023]
MTYSTHIFGRERILSVLIVICLCKLYSTHDSKDYNKPVYYSKKYYTEKPKFPKIDIKLYKDLVSAKNKVIDVVALVELEYRSATDLECALKISFGSLYQLIQNNPLGHDGARVGIVTYNKNANVHLSLETATSPSGAFATPNAIFNDRTNYLNVDKALSLAYSMLKNLSRPDSIRQIWVYISETSVGYPKATAKSIKYDGIEIEVFAVGPRVSYDQINAIASSPKHIIFSPDYCSSKDSLVDLVNERLF